MLVAAHNYYWLPVWFFAELVNVQNLIYWVYNRVWFLKLLENSVYFAKDKIHQDLSILAVDLRDLTLLFQDPDQWRERNRELIESTPNLIVFLTNHDYWYALLDQILNLAVPV